MTDLVVRRLLVDLETPFPVRWNCGDAFRSAFFNALSMSFPVGEQYFIDSLRNALKAQPDSVRERFAGEVQGFVGQEATHRRIHSLFNAHLQRAGLHNEVELRAKRRLDANADRDPRIHVAATAATEHFTALFADWMLRHPEALEGAEPRLKTLWLWHAAEESEHRCTALDIYHAVGGSHEHRVKVFKIISFLFLTDVLRQTVRNLWQDKALFKLSTWRSGWKLLMAPDGMLRGNVALWRDYLAPDFHPSQHDGSRGLKWLQDNAAAYSLVGQAR
jgi:predicted metal-dependent hydrolase